MPERPEDHPDYNVPLRDLTGTHGYALARGEDDDTPPDPGAPVAYVADPMKERPSALTIEGMIQGIGDAAHGAARQGGSPAWVIRVLAALFIAPFLIVAARNVGLI